MLLLVLHWFSKKVQGGEGNKRLAALIRLLDRLQPEIKRLVSLVVTQTLWICKKLRGQGRRGHTHRSADVVSAKCMWIAYSQAPWPPPPTKGWGGHKQSGHNLKSFGVKIFKSPSVITRPEYQKLGCLMLVSINNLCGETEKFRSSWLRLVLQAALHLSLIHNFSQIFTNSSHPPGRRRAPVT